MNRIIDAFGCRFEVITGIEGFVGLGRIWIGDTLVRSGRLPLSVTTQTFPDGLHAQFHLWDLAESPSEVRISLAASFYPGPAKLLRDHSLDPIHPLLDWDVPQECGQGKLDLVLRPAKDSFNGVGFAGFSYHYEYRSESVPLFHLLDRASWELDGDITGATAYSQSSCSDPVAHFEPETAWSTEGELFFLTEAGNQNSIMTHNLPRWASHGSFDFQFRGDATLIGVFERVELIRSIQRREAGKPELKCFDKHIFDQTLNFSTSAKSILLNSDRKSETSQKNLWTWIHDEVERRARAEFGLREEPYVPMMCQNYWSGFTTDSYFKDLIPAARAIGCKAVFVDNLKKSAYTEDAPLPGVFHWNMCCGHEYEFSEKLGGAEGVRRLLAECDRDGIRVYSWTNNDQAFSSPLNDSERDEKRGWYVLQDDARQKFAGAYGSVMSFLDLSVPGARDYFVQSHVALLETTGHNGLFVDSFYNAAFMPISYRDMAPRTMWRGALQAFKELQAAGFSLRIESFGPFGAPAHGHPSSYNLQSLFICYRVGTGNDYSTVPTNMPSFAGHPEGAFITYMCLAHMAGCDLSLFKDGVRIDKRWTAEEVQALRDYHAVLPHLHTRHLQEDGAGVLWFDEGRNVRTLFNFVARTMPLEGRVEDVTTGTTLPRTTEYQLEVCHTYRMTSGLE